MQFHLKSSTFISEPSINKSIKLSVLREKRTQNYLLIFTWFLKIATNYEKIIHKCVILFIALGRPGTNINILPVMRKITPIEI